MKGNPLTQELLVTYNEPNGTQKLLSYLLDNLAGKSMNLYILLLLNRDCNCDCKVIYYIFNRVNLYKAKPLLVSGTHSVRNLILQIANCKTPDDDDSFVTTLFSKGA